MDELEARYEGLTKRRQELADKKAAVVAELAARRRALKTLMEKAREEGFDPDNLAADIKHLSQVITVKLDNFEADIDAAESIIEPMMAEIER